jgi:serine/threonine protein kinase/WD40 repeat protein
VLELGLNQDDDPLVADDVPASGAPTRTVLFKPSSPGDRIGRYKLLQQIGEGGCGVVYMADQQEPVRRRVALKVIKPGMDTKEVLGRFEAERQALALMDHPNIARVLDAGATESGRPFFVMELVRGIRITRYCDENKLNTEQRLELFVQVCHAIQHAHQKGIIHRDIKPSNILVADHDGVPVPKIIDFGIAKATAGQTLTDKTVFTAFEQFIGTPAYISPEQAKLSGLDIDTRSDIYSLGVLLYELLTGKTPFDAKGFVEAGFDEIRRIIREDEPPRPSQKLSTLAAEEQTTTARARQTEPPRLIHLVRGDLDWIVMKCLEKDRNRRYETANGLASDVTRHIKNEPVLARPPSAAYKFQKAFRRNRLAFGAAVAVVLALVAGLGLAAIGWRQTRVERDRALEAQAGEAAQRKAAEASEQKAITAEVGQILLRQQAEAQALAARRSSYNSDLNLIEQSLAANNLGKAQSLVNRQRPPPGQPDLRDWEWRYLWSQTRADEHEVFLVGTNRVFRPISFNGDGRLLVRENGDAVKTVVTELASRRTVWERTNAWSPVFAHQGLRLAFVEPISRTNEAITLLDIATQKETQIVTPWQSIKWVDFTPDDRWLFSVSEQCVSAWDIETRRELWRRGISRQIGDQGRPYVISPDGAAFAAVLPNGRTEVLDTQDGSERFTIKSADEQAFDVMFSPDSSTLVTGAGYTESTIRLWDARSGKAIGSLEGHSTWVSDLLFTPDGTQLISSSADQTIRLWDWATRKPAGVLRGHLGEVLGLAVAPDGRTLASRCGDGSIYLWDITKPSRHLGYQTLPSRLRPASTVFTPDSQSILGVEQGGGVAVWDARTLKETRRLWGASTNQITISQDARFVARSETDGRLHVWDVGGGLERTNFMAAAGRFIGAWFTANGKFLLTSHETAAQRVFDVWDTDNWRRKGSLTLRSESLMRVFTPALPNSCAVWTRRSLQLFDVTKLDEPPKQMETLGFADYIDGLVTSPDDRMAAAVHDQGLVRIWDLATRLPVESFKGFLQGSHSVAFSPNGRRLAAGSSGREAVRLWDVATWQEVLTLSGQGSLFYGLQFSPDGRHLLAINGLGLAHLWSAPSLAEIEAAEAAENQGQPQ